MTETVYILLGSNIGDRERYLNKAIEKMEIISGFELIASSAIYAAEPLDMVGENPPFLNQVIMADYQLQPLQLLDELESIELSLGRTDKGKRLPRTIDLDIILFGTKVLETDRLTIPQKQLKKRPYALVPILQLTPELIDPKTSVKLAEYLSPEDANTVIIYKDHVARNI